MERDEDRGKWAFHLKRKGDFKEAIWSYASEYARSLSRGNAFISETCFEEMFDLCLLQYLKAGRLFEGKKELLAAIRDELQELLQSQEARDGESFDKYFRSCQRKLFPQGRAKPLFSVDSRLLLTKERAALLEV